jgi:SNF2 family DNA or RNA helicase
MGTGKTIMALKVAEMCNLKPVIVCPKILIPVWRGWVEKFFPMFKPVIFNYESLTRGKGGLKDMYIEKKGKKFKWKIDPKKAMLIFDEVHRCKGANTLNSKLLASARDAKIKTLMLSATACFDPREMRGLGYVLGLHGYRDHWVWCLRNGCRKGYFGGLEFTGSSKCLTRLHDDIFGSGLKGSRIRISDLPEGSFPDNMVEARSYQVGKGIWTVDEMYEEMVEQVLEGELDEDDVNGLTVQLRTRQSVEALKVPTLIELATDAIAEGIKPVIFVNFRETLESVTEGLERNGVVNISRIHGDQTEDRRESNIDAFQANESDACICTIQAGGVGLSLHDTDGNHPRMSLICPAFSAIDLKQALGRIHRAGGKSVSRQYIVFASDSVEDEVCKAVSKKLNNLDLLNDGDLNDPIFNKFNENTNTNPSVLYKSEEPSIKEETCGSRY